MSRHSQKPPAGGGKTPPATTGVETPRCDSSVVDDGAARHAVAARVVPAVARLGKRVGAEGGELLRRHQLVDVACIGGVIEVVSPLGALVSQPAVVLEAEWSGHGGAHPSEAFAHHRPRRHARTPWTRGRDERAHSAPSRQRHCWKGIEARSTPGWDHLPNGRSTV